MSKPIFNMGDPVSVTEVEAAYARVFGHPPRQKLDRRTLPSMIVAFTSELRFEFEINLLRGHAIEVAEAA